MIPIEEMEHHPISERLVQILCAKTQNDNPLFFRVLVAYYFSVVASMMRVKIATHDQGDVPVNLYALNLSLSGTGKGKSTNIIENEVLHRFRSRFLEETFPLLAEINLPKLSLKRANRKGTDPDEELVRVQKEFDDLGSLLFTFAEATSPAIKQLRHKLLMADAGALNLQVDEIGSNLSASIEALNTYLELYDVGTIKPKLVKNTSDSKRNEDIHGRTPANLMAFGTPTKLLDGGKTEDELYSLLGTGYARRCFFGYSRSTGRRTPKTAEEIYAQRTDAGNVQFLEDLADRLETLADIVNANKPLIISRDTSLLLIEYQLRCEQEAESLSEHEDLRKAELTHRYFKVMKLAGAYAFVDNSPELTDKHLYHAIKLAEESGAAFGQLLTRDRPYVKLAKYIAAVKRDVTQADLVEDLPFYRGSLSQKQEMMSLAIAYGYKNNIVIKKAFADGIEFIRGETLKVTDLARMVLAYSTDITTDYRNEWAPFDQLHRLTQASGMHWVAHHLNDGYRSEENCKAGFNLAVVDVDGTVSMSTAKLLLKNYKFLLYTTKRHTDQENRFRIIFPLNFTLELDQKDYKEFMSNIYEWLPFEVDTVTNQRSRKWLSHDGHYEYNEGEVLDALPFIPKTSKNEERKAQLLNQQSMDNLERWVINNTGDGNRNNMLLRYAMILVDGGFDFEAVRQKVINLNDKLADKLDEVEIMSTIMISVGKAIAKR